MYLRDALQVVMTIDEKAKKMSNVWNLLRNDWWLSRVIFWAKMVKDYETKGEHE